METNHPEGVNPMEDTRRGRVEDVVQLHDAVERGTSQLIGGLLVLGLALLGMAIGYSSSLIQWVTTTVLGLVCLLLTISGLWTLVRR
jgi:hypothetical protein